MIYWLTFFSIFSADLIGRVKATQRGRVHLPRRRVDRQSHRQRLESRSDDRLLRERTHLRSHHLGRPPGYPGRPAGGRRTCGGRIRLQLIIHHLFHVQRAGRHHLLLLQHILTVTAVNSDGLPAESRRDGRQLHALKGDPDGGIFDGIFGGGSGEA